MVACNHKFRGRPVILKRNGYLGNLTTFLSAVLRRSAILDGCENLRNFAVSEEEHTDMSCDYPTRRTASCEQHFSRVAVDMLQSCAENKL
jgi:hypothetical protein